MSDILVLPMRELRSRQAGAGPGHTVACFCGGAMSPAEWEVRARAGPGQVCSRRAECAPLADGFRSGVLGPGRQGSRRVGVAWALALSSFRSVLSWFLTCGPLLLQLSALTSSPWRGPLPPSPPRIPLSSPPTPTPHHHLQVPPSQCLRLTFPAACTPDALSIVYLPAHYLPGAVSPWRTGSVSPPVPVSRA